MAAAPFRGKQVSKPWGYELLWAQTERYVGKILHVERGHALSLQYHQRKDETIFVLSGVLDLEFGGPDEERQTVRLEAGQSFHVTPLLRHRMVAIETCDVLEASTPEIDDVVRLEDRYGRAGTSTP